MIKAVIIDDESHARQTIATIIKSKFREIHIIGEAANVEGAVVLIKHTRPELVFLDIDLPDGNGFDILKQIDHKKFRVIFITAYQEYAIQAIKFSAMDYILKPVSPVELENAVKNILEEEVDDIYEEKIKAFFQNFNTNTTTNKKIVLKTSEKIHVVGVSKIIRCQADNAYTTVFMDDGKSILVSKGIKKYDEMLSNSGFMRVHQSHLVNLNFISYYDRQDGGHLVMSDSTSIPVSSQRKPILIEYLDSL